MKDIGDGTTVKVHYSGQLDDGTVFDSSKGKDPLEFTVGAGHVIRGFEAAVIGMSVGDSVTVTIAAAEAYGEHRAELVIEIDRDRLPDGMTPTVGDRLESKDTKGNAIPLVIVDVGDRSVTLDGNHPLAGRDLTFEIELVSVA